MKRFQVDEILFDQAKRKRTIFGYVCAILVLFVIASSLLYCFNEKSKVSYVSYTEDSNLDYKVYLKENDYFENDYLESNNQYIASLIDYIVADFDYDLNVSEKDVSYQYSYRIEADVVVKDGSTDNALYKYNEVLYEEENKSSTSNSKVNISKSLKIDYNKYNDLIKSFINTYSLDASSTLTVSMYVDVVGNCEEIEDADTNAVISLDIPLTTKTVAIDMSYDVVDSSTNFMICKTDDSKGYIYLVSGIVFMIATFVVLVVMVRYAIETRSAETIYERNLKKILNNYKNYIQKVNTELDLKKYQVLKVDTFNDMLEIRDTVQEPILMYEDIQKQSTYFFIPSKDKIVYLYSLNLGDIKKEKIEKLNR